MTDGRQACFLFAVAALVRIVAYLGSAVFGTDGGQFLFMADAVSDGRWDEALRVTYHPGYPVLTALLKILLGSSEIAGFWVSLLLGSAAILPLYDLARRAFGAPAAVAGGMLYAFHPALVDVQSDVMSEGTFIFLLAGSAWLTASGIREPGPERSILSGLVASAAFLTRPEGLLAVALAAAWPLAAIFRFRDRIGLRAGGALLALLAALLLAFPFLTWVRAERGRWSISAKGSVAMASAAPSPSESGSAERQNRYRQLGSHLLKLGGVALPFYAAGVWALRGRAGFDALFLLSWPAAYLAGLAWAFRAHPWVSHRYLLPAMAFLTAVAGLGLMLGAAALGRRKAWAGAALLMAIAVLPGLRCFRTQRQETVPGLRDAAAWIRARNAGKRGLLMTTADPMAYLSGSRNAWYPDRIEEALKILRTAPGSHVAYTDRDLAEGKIPYLAALSEHPALEPPRRFGGGTGKAAYFVQSSRGP